MELPLQITFHRLERSDAIAAKVRERAQKLEKYFDGISIVPRGARGARGAGMISGHSALHVNGRSIPVAPRLPGVIVFLALIFALASAHAQTVDKDGIAYLTGGVGADEMERLQAREREFNLKLVFTLVEGNYVSDVAVVVKDKAGNPVLVFFAPGPVVLAKLPRGSYVVEATYGSNTQTRRFDVRERMRTEYVRWPSNPETDFPGPKATDRN